MFSGINTENNTNNPCLTALIYVYKTGINAAACRYTISYTIDVDCWAL